METHCDPATGECTKPVRNGNACCPNGEINTGMSCSLVVYSSCAPSLTWSQVRSASPELTARTSSAARTATWSMARATTVTSAPSTLASRAGAAPDSRRRYCHLSFFFFVERCKQIRLNVLLVFGLTGHRSATSRTPRTSAASSSACRTRTSWASASACPTPPRSATCYLPVSSKHFPAE